MSIIRYSYPFPETRNSIREHLGRLFDLAAPAPAESFGEWAPALDAFEDKDKYIVQLEVPGVKKSDINVSVQEGTLTISGERNSQRDMKDGTTHRTERIYGKFSRSVTLPAAVQSDKVSATYKDGVLTVELPKAEEAKPKQIEVKVS